MCMLSSEGVVFCSSFRQGHGHSHILKFSKRDLSDVSYKGNQSGTKLKPISDFSWLMRIFARFAFVACYALASSFDWLTVLFTFTVIGRIRKLSNVTE